MMCHGQECGHGGCTPSRLGKLLLIVGGLNWGLVGVGMLMNSDWNVVKMLLGAWPTVEALVYILVGVAAVMKIFHCKCAKCMAACSQCSVGGGSMEGKM